MAVPMAFASGYLTASRLADSKAMRLAQYWVYYLAPNLGHSKETEMGARMVHC